MDKAYTRGDSWLFVSMVCYAIVNVVAVAWGPNFAVLDLFISIGPLFGTAVVLAGQFGCDRPFTWLAMVFFLLAMAVAGCVNILIFISASGAV